MSAPDSDSSRLHPAKEHAVSTEDDQEGEQGENLGTSSPSANPLHTKTRQLGPFTLNLALLPMKFYYLFSFGALACVAPFLPVFYRYMSMSARQTGVITGLQPCVALVGKPFWAAVADKYRRHRFFMVAGFMVFSVLLFSIVLLPRPAEPVGERGCDLLECTNTTARNDSKCLAFIGPQPTQTLKGSVELNSCRNIIVQCCVSGYLRSLSCHSTNCLGVKHGTVKYEDKMFIMDYNLVKLLLRCFGDKGNRSRLDQSEETFACSPMCTQRLMPGRHTGNHSLCMEDVENLWPNLTSIISGYRGDKKGENKKYQEHEKPNNSKMFIILLGIVLTAYFFFMDSMADAVVVKFLTKTGRSGDFGKQRLWGSVGWGLVSILAGLGIDKSAEYRNQNQFIIPFCGFLGLNLITVICVWKLPIEVLLEGHEKPRIFQNLKSICTSYPIVTFLLAVLVFGVCHGMSGIYLFWFLQDMGGSYLLMGLCLVVNCLAEIPVMFFAGHLIRLCGYHGVLYLAFLCYFVRFLSYSFLSNPWFVLAVEPLHGVTFGAFWAAAASYGGKIAPAGMAATVIALVGAAHFGLGYVIAGFAGGVLYSIHGARNTFRGLAVALLGIWLLFAISQELPKFMSHRHCSPSCQDGRSKVNENRTPDAHELHGMISEDSQEQQEPC